MHSNSDCASHEVLGLYSGWVKAKLGDPDGKFVTVNAGDIIIVPARVAHKNIDQSPDLEVVDAYPKGRIQDIKYGKPDERIIRKVGFPANDHIYGKTGPLLEIRNHERNN